MPDETPEVSVIIPSYKTTKYIGTAIDSVLQQTFPSYEIIVVSDGCPDSAALEEVLRGYGSKVRYIWQENQGTGAARNTAILAGRGEFVLQLDADDILAPNCLEAMVAFLREHPEFDAAYCNSYNFAESAEAGAKWGSKWTEAKKTLYMDVYPSDGPVSFCSIMETRTAPRVLGSTIRRDTLLRIGLYDGPSRFAEDLDLWLRMLKADPPGNIGYTREPLGYYRLRDDNYTLDVGYAKRLLAVLEKCARTMHLSNAEKACLERRIAQNRYDVHMLQGRLAIRDGRWKDAIGDYEYCYKFSGKFKYFATLNMLRVCPWAVPMGLRLIGRGA